MWICSTLGFLSIVQHRSDPDTLVVRGRDRQHLAAFCRALSPRIEMVNVLSTPEADYPFRVLCTRAQVAEFLTEEVGRLGYANFKGAVDRDASRNPRDGGSTRRYASMLHEIWSVVRENLDPRGRSRRTTGSGLLFSKKKRVAHSIGRGHDCGVGGRTSPGRDDRENQG